MATNADLLATSDQLKLPVLKADIELLNRPLPVARRDHAGKRLFVLPLKLADREGGTCEGTRRKPSRAGTAEDGVAWPVEDDVAAWPQPPNKTGRN